MGPTVHLQGGEKIECDRYRILDSGWLRVIYRGTEEGETDTYEEYPSHRISKAIRDDPEV